MIQYNIICRTNIVKLLTHFPGIGRRHLKSSTKKKLVEIISPNPIKCSPLRQLKALVFFLIFFISTPLFSAPNVVVSIAPLHSLISGVMEGVGAPELLYATDQSPHTQPLKPSSVRKIYNANLLVWVGPEFEQAMANVVNQAKDKTLILTLIDQGELKTLLLRDSRHFDVHGTENIGNDASGHNHGTRSRNIDPHFWLSFDNARHAVKIFSEWLGKIDSNNSFQYATNAQRMNLRINRLHSELIQEINSTSDIPYLVFHDAYQYFELEFGLESMGSIAVSSDRTPSAQRIRELKVLVTRNGVRCIFSEPQLESKILKIFTEGTNVKIAQLDPIGISLEPGLGLWFDLMRRLSTSLKTCLESNQD